LNANNIGFTQDMFATHTFKHLSKTNMFTTHTFKQLSKTNTFTTHTFKNLSKTYTCTTQTLKKLSKTNVYCKKCLKYTSNSMIYGISKTSEILVLLCFLCFVEGFQHIVVKSMCFTRVKAHISTYSDAKPK